MRCSYCRAGNGIQEVARMSNNPNKSVRLAWLCVADSTSSLLAYNRRIRDLLNHCHQVIWHYYMASRLPLKTSRNADRVTVARHRCRRLGNRSRDKFNVLLTDDRRIACRAASFLTTNSQLSELSAQLPLFLDNGAHIAITS